MVVYKDSGFHWGHLTSRPSARISASSNPASPRCRSLAAICPKPCEETRSGYEGESNLERPPKKLQSTIKSRDCECTRLDMPKGGHHTRVKQSEALRNAISVTDIV